MRQLIKPKEKFSLGLDIGTQAIKLVKLNHLQEGIELSEFDLIPSQPEAADILKKIKQSQGIETVNIGVCGSSTVIRHVNFPRMNKEELRQALKFEAQKHIPFSLSEVNLDAYILKEDLPDNKMLVLIVAAKKELVNQRIKLLEDAGLKANLIDIDSIALINAFNFNYSQEEPLKQKTAALLNIGASISNLNILEKGVLRLSRDIHIAGNNFTQKIVDIFGIDFKSAEELKLNPDQERAGKISASQESMLTNLAAEIRISFDYYESQSSFSVAKIFLSGGGAKFSGLKDALANSLGIEVEYWDALRQLKLSGAIDAQKIHALSAELAVAVGLALRQ